MTKTQENIKKTVLEDEGDCLGQNVSKTKKISGRKKSDKKTKPIEPDEIIAEYVDTTKKKPRGANSPWKDKNGALIKKGDNSKYLTLSMTLMGLPDIDLTDTAQVQNRLNQFFQIHVEQDMKPTVSGLGLALNGMDRRRLYEIKSGNTTGSTPKLPQEVRGLIKKAYRLMENLWENYMQNGKINPASGIFLGKNHFGYEDKVEHVIATNKPQEDYSADDIRQRYLPPSDCIRLSDTDKG